MTIVEARLRLNASLGDATAQAALRQSEALETARRNARAEAWARQRTATLAHEARLAQLEADRIARCEARDREAAALDDLLCQRVKQRRSGALKVDDAYRVVDRWQDELGAVSTDPLVQRLRDHAQAQAHAHGVTVDWRAHRRRGTAWRRKQHLRTPVITSFWTYATFEHELAHVVAPDATGQRWTTALDGSRTSPAEELAAWLWAIDHALEWTFDMHRNLTEGLTSYRGYATERERSAIDAWLGPLGFRRAQLRRALRSH